MTVETVASELAARVLPMIESAPRAMRPRLVAQLERRAAERYRGWADLQADGAIAAGLRACAEREERVASAVEAAYAPAPDEEKWLASTLPQIAELYGAALNGLGVEDQFRVQAAAERRGADLWRLLAARESSDEVKATLETCARLEEESATYLDGVVGSR